MKKFTKMALLLLLIVASVFVFTACDDKPDVIAGGEIFIKDSGMPQLVFVQGEELDLSNGVLSVKDGDAVKEIPMNDANITVTGYDKTKLGEQTITLTYGGQSTQLTITVVARMQIVEHDTEYLIGDKLNTGVGRLKITRNDGSNYTILLSAEGVQITGFDANKTGSQQLTVKYTNGDATYECQYDIQVYAVESVEFHAPKKLYYSSHDAGMDLTEGYFTLTGNGGKLTKDVAITEDMVSGFDLGAVTEANSPLSQTLTVAYNGKSYNFDIQLTYSAITMFQKEAAAYAELDWTTNEIPVISDELGEKALKLMEAYLDLSKAEQTYISYKDTMNVARAALMYGMACMDPEFVAMEGAVLISGGGLEFTCVSREAVEQAIEILDNEDSQLYRISPIMVGMVEAFADEEVIPDVFFGDFGMLPNEIYEELLNIFEHMLEVHDALLDIPEDWQTVGVEFYAAEIENFYDIMFSNDYVDGGMAYIYSYVSNWRTTGDTFDILYHYYYGKGDAQALNSLAKVNMPTCLSEIAYHVTEMLAQVDDITNYAQMDTTLLMYHYYSAVRLAAELKASDDTMAKNLYNSLPVNSLMGLSDESLFYFDTLLEYVKTMEGGYYEYSGGLLGVEAYHNLMDAYMHLITNIVEDDDYEYSDRYNADLEAMFALFVQMKPTEQYYFLNTLNAFYSMSIPPMAFDDTGDYAELMTLFTRRIHEYYRENLGSAAGAYNDLIMAIEIYAQRISYEGWVEAFTARMDAVDAAYKKMSADEKAAFDRYLGEAYAKYAGIRERFVEAEGYTDLGEWENIFAELDDAVLNVEIAATYINQGHAMYSLFFSAYERAQNISEYILANAPTEILEMYYFEDRYGLDENGENSNQVVLMSYEYLMTTYRTMYISYLLSAMGGSCYDYYIASQLPTFMDQTFDVSWIWVKNTEDNPLEYDVQKVLAAMKTFREMSLNDQVLFVMMEGEQAPYWAALGEFLNTYYEPAAAQLALKLLELEQTYILYSYSPEADALASLMALWQEAQDMYAAMSAEDLASFADLEDLYTFYGNVCENLTENAA